MKYKINENVPRSFCSAHLPNPKSHKKKGISFVSSHRGPSPACGFVCVHLPAFTLIRGLSNCHARSPLLSVRLTTLSRKYGFFVSTLSRADQVTPSSFRKDVHVGLFRSSFPVQTVGVQRSCVQCRVTSQCRIDVNKNDYKEVKECADDAQQGQDGLLPFLFDLKCLHILKGDDCGAHILDAHLSCQGDPNLKKGVGNCACQTTMSNVSEKHNSIRTALRLLFVCRASLLRLRLVSHFRR